MVTLARFFRFFPRVREPSEETYNKVYADHPKYAKETSDSDTDFVEYRNEANRPWWKFFDEYEYRHKSNERSTRKWYKWYDDNDSPAERKLLVKLDIMLTFYCFLVYWIKYLDQANINNAYVSDMKEDLGFKGNDLINTHAFYNAGCIIFQIPFLYILPKYPSHIVLPIMDIGWGLMTLLKYKATNVKGIQALRFFVGVFEAAWYPVMHFMLGSWFKPQEINRRAGFAFLGQFLGILTSGLLAAASVTHLEGKSNLAGWRWLFIVDAIITIPVGIAGIWVLPGSPEKCTSMFLTDEEIVLARERVKASKKEHQVSLFDWQLWKRILGSWRIWALSVYGSLFWMGGNSTTGSFLLWLKSLTVDGHQRYTNAQINNYSTIPPALGVLGVVVCAFIADGLGSRIAGMTLLTIITLIVMLILAVWDVPEGAKWFAFSLTFWHNSLSPTLYSWYNDINRHNHQERAIVMMVVNLVSQIGQTWGNVVVWKTVYAPRFLAGYIFAASLNGVFFFWTFLVLYKYKQQERLSAKEQGIILYDGNVENVEGLDSVERVDIVYEEKK